MRAHSFNIHITQKKRRSNERRKASFNERYIFVVDSERNDKIIIFTIDIVQARNEQRDGVRAKFSVKRIGNKITLRGHRNNLLQFVIYSITENKKKVNNFQC